MGTISALPVAPPRTPWSDLGACEHAVQIYGNDPRFLDGLEAYVVAGLQAGEGVVVIATAMHLHGLEERLRRHGVDVDAARSERRYIARLAEDVLAAVMDGDWPDERRFGGTLLALLRSARGPGRRVRAFAEMVAVLWSRGHHAATIQLELLWSKACAAEKVPVLCAYPRDTFSRNATESIVEICRIHSRVAPPLA